MTPLEKLKFDLRQLVEERKNAPPGFYVVPATEAARIAEDLLVAIEALEDLGKNVYHSLYASELARETLARIAGQGTET